MGDGEEVETEKGWVEGKTREDLKFKGKRWSYSSSYNSWCVMIELKREGESRQELTREYRVLSREYCLVCELCIYIILTMMAMKSRRPKRSRSWR